MIRHNEMAGAPCLGADGAKDPPLGGGLSLLGEPLRAAVETSLRHYVMEAFAPGPKVALSRLCEDAVPVGALQLAAQTRETNRI
jgi:glucokinase